MSECIFFLCFPATMVPFALLIALLSLPAGERAHVPVQGTWLTSMSRRRRHRWLSGTDQEASTWPATVVELARAFDDGKDCAFALHDAIVEAGHATLADVFAQSAYARNCWVISRILAHR